MNINIDISSGTLSFCNREITFEYNYELKISQVLVLDKIVYVLGFPSKSVLEHNDEQVFRNNVFAYNLDGTLLWDTGVFSFKLSEERTIVIPATYMGMDGEYLKLYYQSDHEVWLDRLTGEKVKEEFVFKK